MRKMTKKNESIILGLIFVIVLILLAYLQNRKEISLRQNRELTIGKLTRIRGVSGAGKVYEFKYLVDKNWIKGHDPDNATWPFYHRKGKAQKGKYYPVEFDKTNPEYSKILITKKPLTEKEVEKYLKKAKEISN